MRRLLAEPIGQKVPRGVIISNAEDALGDKNWVPQQAVECPHGLDPCICNGSGAGVKPRAADDFEAIRKRVEELRGAQPEPWERTWCAECGKYGGTHTEGCSLENPLKYLRGYCRSCGGIDRHAPGCRS